MSARMNLPLQDTMEMFSHTEITMGSIRSGKVRQRL